MKRKKFDKKLALNKVTIACLDIESMTARLDGEALGKIKGKAGSLLELCTEPDESCSYVAICPCG